MKKLINQNLPPRTFTVLSLAEVRDQALHSRRLAISHLSGYPAGSHVVGRIQRMIKLDSMNEMLESLLKLRNLARLASDILNTVPGARVDKQQFVRSEILAYVQLQATLYGAGDLSPDDQDLIAYMIASTESPDSSWYLDYDATDKNHFIKFHKLLKQLEASPGSVTIQVASDGPTPFTIKNTESAIPGAAVIYNPDTETIVNISATAKYKERTNEAMSVRSAAGNTVEIEARVNDIHANAVAVLTLSQIRVWDHVFALFTSTEIWDSWITPRTRTDESSNVERAKGLKNFAAYLHSLLMYPHFFSIEAFMSTYDVIEETLVKFVPLPAHEVARYEANVRKFDILDAKADVADVFNSFKNIKNKSIDTIVTAFPQEFISLFGFEDAVNLALGAASRLSLPVDITTLRDLANQEFNTLTLSHPISKFEVVHAINDLIIMKGIVSNHIKEACNAISSGTPKFLSGDAVEAIKSLGLHISYGLGVKIDLSYDPTSSSPDEYVNGNLKYHALLPASTYDAVRTGRKELLYSVDSTANFTRKLQSPERVIKMPDIASKLRRIAGHDDWNCLMPSSLFYNQEFFTSDTLRSSDVMIERLLESLTGMNFELIKRTIGNPYSRELFATYLSSFALMYVTTDGSAAGTIGGKGSSALVEGYGQPYGTTYVGLEQKQGKFDEAMILQITESVYLRILKFVPLPSDELSPFTNFMVQLPYYGYKSNSKKIEVKKWVMAPGLMNFALAPAMKYQKPSPLLLDKRFAYLNDALFIQTEPMWRPEIDESAVSSIPQTSKTWNRDKYILNVEYRVLSSYGNPAISATANKSIDDDESITKLVKELETAGNEITKNAPSNSPEKAEHAITPGVSLSPTAIPPISNKDAGPTDLASPSFSKTKPKGKS